MQYIYVVGVVPTDAGDLKITEEEGIATAEVINFFNDLFDSVNAKERDEINELRCPVTDDSAHHAFWTDARTKLRKMRYVEKVTREIVKSVPTLTNWLFTIDGFQKVWKIVNLKYNFTNLKTRYINQDLAENFFGQIRSHAVRHTNPTPRQFEHSFFTLLVNNMKSVSIIGGNCEIVEDGSMLFTLEQCLKDDSDVELHGVIRNNDVHDEPHEIISDKIVHEDSIIAAFSEKVNVIISCILKEFKFCQQCDDSLNNCNFPTCARQIVCMVNKLLKTRAHRRNILKILLQFFENWNVNMDWHECTEHRDDMFPIMIRVIAAKALTWWCEKKNSLVRDANEDMLRCDLDCAQNVIKIKRMREEFKKQKENRKRLLEDYKESRKRMKI